MMMNQKKSHWQNWQIIKQTFRNDDWQIFKPRTGRNGSRHPENDQNTAGKMTVEVLGDVRHAL